MSNIKHEKEERKFILKYFNLGTIDSTEIRRYERSKKKKLNVTLAMIIGVKNIHYNVLYTEEKITYNRLIDGKQSRTSTILEKINFINKTLDEFNQYYDDTSENTIVTIFDDDINKISAKVKDIKFDIVSKEVLNSTVVKNKINEDIFYKSVLEFRKKDFNSIVKVKKQVNRLLHLDK